MRYNSKTAVAKGFICLVCALLSIVCCTFVRCEYAKKFVDSQTLFVDFEAPQTAFTLLMLTVAIIISSLLFFLIGKQDATTVIIRGEDKITKNLIVRSLEAIIGILFVVYSVSYFLDFLSGNIQVFNDPYALIIVKIADAVKLILSPFCAVYFLFAAVMDVKKPLMLSILSNAPSLWFSMYVLVYFVDTSCYANRYGRSLMILSLVFCIAFFVRDSLPFLLSGSTQCVESDEKNGESKKISKRAYAVISYLCSYLCILNAFSGVKIDYFTEQVLELSTRIGVGSGIEKTIISVVGFYSFAKMANVIFSQDESRI